MSVSGLPRQRHLVLIRRLAKPLSHLGSAAMRGNQLAGIIGPHLSQRVKITVLPFHAGLVPPVAMRVLAAFIPEGSVVIFVKSAARGLREAHLEPIRRRAAAIGFDSVDTPLEAVDFDVFDFHVAASLAARDALRRHLDGSGRESVPVELLHHHADPRLDSVLIPASRPFRCVYLGHPINAAIPQSLKSDVEIIPVKYARNMTPALRRLGRYGLHFAVRPEPAADADRKEYKPFTKGFTAARCEANVLVNAEANDARALLGDDYPFLVHGNDPAKVVAGYEYARETYGGPVWIEGLERMKALNALVSPLALARRLEEIILRVTA